MAPFLPTPGTPKEELDTPALLIDLPVMESNISRMADFFRGLKANLRPHAKHHKCPIVGHKQIEAGAIGLCCAKVGEAEALVAGGIGEILITSQVVGATKIARLLGLARQAHVTVAVDNAENVADLSEASRRAGVELDVVVEVNVGQNRCGVLPGEPVLRLANAVQKAKDLRFAGVMGYEGHLVAIEDYETRASRAKLDIQKLIDSVELLERSGVPVGIVSSGGTGTYNITGTLPKITEVQAGSYLFMDTQYRGVLTDFDCAASVLATVISRPSKGLAVVDAGRKAVSNDHGMPQVKDLPGATLVGLSEEHGNIAVEGEAANLKVGDKIEIIPSHTDTTVNLHDYYFTMRDDSLEAVWEIAGRGKFR
ncbi:MAG: DSD1 family PLP-dependent enzyme [Dehalococcoidia bacterium]